ncbi:uncharacterized protein LOC110943145 [Helianthus annuus]|uniref:uncharacterized protein LOC110943145 n=1 Tax=Helianthus annuus TaxID=4232 RepID=UPI000B9079AA|nr:uncharacterized protein LOC110943145 [Helianthus annuus]
MGINGLRWKWEWKRSSRNDVEEAKWQQFVSMVAIPVLSDGIDEWTWTKDSSGVYRVKSIKEILHNARYTLPQYVFIWNGWVPKKVGFLAWRAELDRLPTRCALVRRNINVESHLCPLCGDEPESTEHLFLSCGFVQSVWAVIAQWCKLPNAFVFSIRDILDMDVHTPGSAKLKKALYAVCLTSLWCVWKVRNETVFNQASPSVQKTVSDIKSLSFVWVKSRSKEVSLDWEIWNGFNLHKMG